MTDKPSGTPRVYLSLLLLNFVLSLGVGFLPELADDCPGTPATAIQDGDAPSVDKVQEEAVDGRCVPPFTTEGQILLGGIVFVGLALLELLWYAQRNDAHRRASHETWPVQDEATTRLHNISLYLRQVIQDAYGPTDRYVRHFLSELLRLERRLRDAAEKKELRVFSDHFLSVGDVLGAFSSDSERVFRYTWPISRPGPLFTIPAWRQFFGLTAAMLKDRSLREVKVLVILDDWALMNEPNVVRLLDFFNGTRHAACKVILCADYQAIARDNDVPDHELDFGLYGETLLYVTEEEDPPQTHGRFTKDPNTINLYKSLFETIWESTGLTRTHRTSPGRTPTAEDLMDETAACTPIARPPELPLVQTDLTDDHVTEAPAIDR